MKAILKGGPLDGTEVEASSTTEWIDVPQFTRADKAVPIRDEDVKMTLTIKLWRYVRAHGTEQGALIFRPAA